MSNAKEFLSILITDYHNFEKYFKSLLNNYSRITNFIERVLSVIPLELIVIFLFSILIFYILNSIAKDTSKINFVISVILSTVILYFILKVGILNKKKLSDSLNRLIISPLLIMGFVFVYYFILTGIKTLISKYTKNKVLNQTSLDKSIFNLQITYNQIMSEYYSLPENNFDTTDLENKLSDLQLLTERVISIIQPTNNKINSKDKKVFTSEPIAESQIISSNP